MKSTITNFLLFWWHNGKLTTLFILLVLYLTLCTTARGDTYQVAWVAQFKMFDTPAKEVMLNSGEYGIDGTKCFISKPRAFEKDAGEYRTVECINYDGLAVAVACTLDGEIHDFMSPTASLLLQGAN